MRLEAELEGIKAAEQASLVEGAVSTLADLCRSARITAANDYEKFWPFMRERFMPELQKIAEDYK